MINRLCEEYGTRLPGPHPDSKPYYTFPQPEQLSAPEVEQRLRELGFGYRAAYVQKSCALLLELAEENNTTPMGYLDMLKNLPYTEAREALREFVGVGPKVADCIALFGLAMDHVVPVDTHVWQIATRDYQVKRSSSSSCPLKLIIVACAVQRQRGQRSYQCCDLRKGAVKIKTGLGRQGWLGATGEHLQSVAHLRLVAETKCQILFTADLRSFANFNDPLSTPPATPVKEDPALLEAPSAVINADKNVKPVVVKQEETIVEVQGNTLAERIKYRKRSRPMATPSPSPIKRIKSEE